MQKSDEKVILYIPLGITTRIDYFPGFGKVELIQSIAGIIVGIILAILSYLILKNSLIVIVILILFIGGSIMATTKGSTNQSVVDVINDILIFNKSKKIYPYRTLQEWT